MSAKYRSPSFLLPNELNTSANPLNTDGNPATGTGINSLYSMEFDGIDDFIDCGNDSSLQITGNLTISLWFKTTSTGGNLISDTPVWGGCYNILMGGGNGQLWARRGNGTSTETTQKTSNSYNDGEWHNIAFVSDSTMRIYIDGVLDTQSTVNTPSSIGGFQVLKIGDGFTNFPGQIDEVAIFNRALNTIEISALYDGTGSNKRPSNLMATDLNPIAYYPLGEQAQNSGYPSATGNEWQFPNGVLQDYVMDFNIAEQSVDIANDFHNYTEMSVSVWVNFNNFSGYQYVFSAGDASASVAGSVFAIATITSTGEIYSWDGSNLNNTGISVILNTWNNILVTQTGTTRTVLINGQQAGNSFTTSALNLSQGTAFIGKYLTPGFSANAKISNVAIWNSDQSTNKDDIYNNGSPQTTYTVSPQNWWKLNATSVYTPSAPNYTTALDFNGFSYINIVNGLQNIFPSNSIYTISTWVNMNSPQDTGCVWGGVVASNFYIYVLSSSKLRIGKRGVTGHTDITYSLVTGDWINIVAVYNSTTNVKIYIDNVFIQDVTVGANTNMTGDFRIASGLGGYILNCKQSNVAVFNSALTSSQVSTLFNFGTPETAISFSPQAWWKLDDQTAITDSSGNGNTGTNNGATDISSGVAVVPSWKIPDASGTSNGVSTTLPSTALQQSDLQFDSPYSNYSLSFDGATYVNCGNDSILTPANAISISLWVKTNDSGNYKGLIDKWSSSTGYMIHLGASGANQGKPVFGIGASDISSSVVVNDGGWHHVAVTCDNTTGYIYVDGVQTGTGSLTMTGIANSDNLKIAGDNASTFYLNGKIDETAIFNTALTEAQVLEIYNNGKPKDLSTFSGTAPISWWRLGENAYFVNNDITLPNSVSEAPNGVSSGTATSMLSADAPGTYANGIGTDLDIIDRVGDAPLSTSNSQSYNMIPSDISPYVPSYVGTTIANAASMTFNGVDSFFNTTNIDLGINSTLTLWFKPGTSPVVNDYALIGEGSNGFDYVIRKSGGAFYVWVGSSFHNYGAVITTNINANGWNFLAIQKAGDTINVYLKNTNGEFDATATISAWATTSMTFDRIGSRTISPPSQVFSGSIDEVAGFNYTLTAQQIYNDIYLPTKSGTGLTASLDNNPNLTAPVAWYRMGD